MNEFFDNYLNIIALLWFLATWLGYSYFVDYKKGSTYTLVKIMHKYRLQWMKHMLKRSDRLNDIHIIGNFLRSTTFFASTSILVVAGLIAVMGASDKAFPALEQIPFAEQTTLSMWILKTTLLLVIFIYSFFKFTWVLRQYKYALVLIVAAPQYHDGDSKDQIRKSTHYVSKTATMLTNAARHFNMGIRSYYFGLAALGWYISPEVLILTSTIVVLVIYRREFMSRTLQLLA